MMPLNRWVWNIYRVVGSVPYRARGAVHGVYDLIGLPGGGHPARRLGDGHLDLLLGGAFLRRLRDRAHLLVLPAEWLASGLGLRRRLRRGLASRASPAIAHARLQGGPVGGHG